MKALKISGICLLFGLMILVTSCGDDEDFSIENPTSYIFERNGQSTVSFSGQTTRILMSTELIDLMKDKNASAETMLAMYRNEGPNGEDVSPFMDQDLNNETKSIKSKVAASRDFFSSNTAVGSQIKNHFENWISAQHDEVFPAWEQLAQPGVAGQIADGSSTRYVDARGLEFNQLVNKGLIGALMLDQMLNNYLGGAVLDEGNNREDNDAAIPAEGKNYTTMEHKWDEAYGYLFGTSSDPADPLKTLGEDAFLSKYLARVEDDSDFTGIARTVFDAFKLGRAAIVAGDYDTRDVQAEIIREKMSEVIGVRAVYYLVNGANALPASGSDFGAAFHDLSEAYGFVYSLQFTRKPNSNAPYFTKSEVDSFIGRMLGDGPNGLWNAEAQTLIDIADEIAGRFDFTVNEAAQ